MLYEKKRIFKASFIVRQPVIKRKERVIKFGDYLEKLTFDFNE